MNRLATLLLALLAGLGVLLMTFGTGANTALAQSPPSPTPTPVDPAPAPAPDPIASPNPNGTIPTFGDDEDEDGIEDRNLLGFEQYGEFPLGNYEIGCDEGAWNHFGRKFWCINQAWPFDLSKNLVGLANSTVSWSLNFELADALTAEAGGLATAYDTSIVAGLELKHLAWMVACFWAGWLIIRARTSQALGEIATSIIAAFLGAFLIANPVGYMTGFVDTVQGTSQLVMQSVSGERGDQDIAAQSGAQLETAFVAAPYDLINWGRPLTGNCAAARDVILAGGAYGNGDTPRDVMNLAGCEDEADFNHDPSPQRAMAGGVILFGAGLLLVLMIVLSVSLLVVQFVLLIVWAVTPIVLTLAIAPGAGRQLAYKWFGANVLVFMVNLAAVLTLAFVTSMSTFLLSSTSDFTILQRMLLLDTMVIAGFVFRKRLMRVAEAASHGAGSWLARTVPSRSMGGTWVGAGAAGALTGVGLSQRFSQTAADVPGGRRAVTAGYRTRHRVTNTPRAIGSRTRSMAGRNRHGPGSSSRSPMSARSRREARR